MSHNNNERYHYDDPPPPYSETGTRTDSQQQHSGSGYQQNIFGSSPLTSSNYAATERRGHRSPDTTVIHGVRWPSTFYSTNNRDASRTVGAEMRSSSTLHCGRNVDRAKLQGCTISSSSTVNVRKGSEEGLDRLRLPRLARPWDPPEIKSSSTVHAADTTNLTDARIQSSSVVDLGDYTQAQGIQISASSTLKAESPESADCTLKNLCMNAGSDLTVSEKGSAARADFRSGSSGIAHGRIDGSKVHNGGTLWAGEGSKVDADVGRSTVIVMDGAQVLNKPIFRGNGCVVIGENAVVDGGSFETPENCLTMLGPGEYKNSRFLGSNILPQPTVLNDPFTYTETHDEHQVGKALDSVREGSLPSEHSTRVKNLLDRLVRVGPKGNSRELLPDEESTGGRVLQGNVVFGDVLHMNGQVFQGGNMTFYSY